MRLCERSARRDKRHIGHPLDSLAVELVGHIGSLDANATPSRFTLSSLFQVRSNTSDREDDMKRSSACTSVAGMAAKRLTAL